VSTIEGDEKVTAREQGLRETTGAGYGESRAMAVRRCGLGISAGLIACVLGGASISMAADDLGWIVDHIKAETYSAKTFDDAGNFARETFKTTERIDVSRAVTETRAKDESGMIRVQTRVTKTGKLGGSSFTEKVVVTENRLPGSSRLVVVSILTNVKLPNGTMSTTEQRGAGGTMRIVSRTTTLNDTDTGEKTTTVEGLSTSGRLVVRSVTTQT
jgi:hypothetical protein